MQCTVDQHRAELLDGVAALHPFELSLLDARGCRVAHDIVAPGPMPAFSSAAREGFAVRVADVAAASVDHPVRLLVVDAVEPGQRPRLAVVPGAAVRVRMGAALPEGTEAVLPAEAVEVAGEEISVSAPVVEGAHIRRIGAEVQGGATVLAQGARIDARRIALLAALGLGRVLAHPRPRVVIVTIGDELVEPGTATLPGAVPDSNGVMLAALVQQLGAVAYRVGPVADDVATLRQVLEDQLVRADLMLVVGGMAASSYEAIVEVVSELGEMAIHRVAMLPGIAQGIGHLGEERVPVLTLPGYPAAAFVSFEVFAKPLIRRMAGAPDVLSSPVRAELLAGVRSPAGRRQFVPSLRLPGADGVLRVQPLHSEHVTAELAQADCLLVVPDAVEQLLQGDVVDVLLLDGAE